MTFLLDCNPLENQVVLAQLNISTKAEEGHKDKRLPNLEATNASQIFSRDALQGQDNIRASNSKRQSYCEDQIDATKLQLDFGQNTIFFIIVNSRWLREQHRRRCP